MIDTIERQNTAASLSAIQKSVSLKRTLRGKITHSHIFSRQFMIEHCTFNETSVVFEGFD